MSEILPTPLLGTYWVLPKQFLAGEYPGGSNSEVTEKRLLALLDAGVRTFIDLTDEDEVNGNFSCIPGYRGILRRLSQEQILEVTYAKIPIVDRDIPTPWTLRCILDVIDRSLDDENPVYLHCWAGRGRTGTVVGCYLKRHGLADDGNVIRTLAQLRRNAANGRESSPQTKDQIRMVTTWKQGA